MNVIKSRFVYHLMAIITVAIWGTTFVSTKILIQHGLSPSDIFFYRFTLAYLCMWCISYKKLFVKILFFPVSTIIRTLFSYYNPVKSNITTHRIFISYQKPHQTVFFPGKINTKGVQF